MSDLPIPFTAPMIRALLREIEAPGTGKTQTRRLPKITWEDDANAVFSGWRAERAGLRHWQLIDGMGVGANIKTPYAPGDRLWVKEQHVFDAQMDHLPASKLSQHEPRGYPANNWLIEPACSMIRAGRLRPPMFMPRWASRITLLVTDVRVMRLQDISEADAIAEGVEPYDGIDPDLSGYRWYGDGAEPGQWLSSIGSFRTLWNSLHGPGAWDRNDWVAAYTFIVHHCNIDAMPKEGGA